MKRVAPHIRFWRKTEAHESGCVLWTAAHNKKGYGYFSFGGTTQLAHRVAWILAHGPIPDGLCVLHHCDHPPCVNVEHLFLGSNAENVADRHNKGRSGAPHFEAHGRAVLTWPQVDEIRLLRGTVTQRALAAQFGVSHTQIARIHSNRSWNCKIADQKPQEAA